MKAMKLLTLGVVLCLLGSSAPAGEKNPTTPN